MAMRVKGTISVIASILILGSIVGSVSFNDAFAGGGGPPQQVRICHYDDGTELWGPRQINENGLNGHLDNHTDGSGIFDHVIALDGSEDDVCRALNQQNSLHIFKFYDANVNGMKDLEEPYIADWLVEVAPFEVNTDMILSSSTTLTTAWIEDIDGDVLVSEAQEENWVPTNQEVPPIKITVFDSDPLVTIASNTLVTIEGETTVQFGNVCLGDGGAHSKGFWTNKGNGLIDNDDISDLNLLNLVDDSGSDKIFGTNSDVKTWLKEARAKNMANMLSAQLAAMQLNVNHGYVDPTAYVYAQGVDDLTNFVMIQDLMDIADAELDDNPDTTSPSDDRDYQEIIKDALDDANNNTNFVQPEICPPFMAIEEPPV